MMPLEELLTEEKYPLVKKWHKRMINDDQINHELGQHLRNVGPILQSWLKKQKGYPKL